MQTDSVQNLNFDLCWTDNHVKADFFAKMQTHQKINHYPGNSSDMQEWAFYQEKTILEWD